MESMLESLRDPHARHAMMVHLPIIFGLLGVVPLAALCLNRLRSDRLRWIVVAWFLTLSLSSLVAAHSGAAAARNLERLSPPLHPRDAAAVAKHEHRGGRAWIWPLIPCALVALTARPRVRPYAGAAAMVAAAGVALWFGVIAHVGGRLVYARGLGVPARQVEDAVQVAEAAPQNAGPARATELASE